MAPTSKYVMDHGHRGRFILINNRIFHGNECLTRHGTEIDGLKLHTLFRSLGFTVTQFDDQTANQMLQIMTDVGGEDHSCSDCFGAAVLTHGTKGKLYGSDNETIAIPDLVDPIKTNCTLTGKPKLFFFQACRGDNHDEGQPMDDFLDALDGLPQRIPKEADCLYAYSTPFGYVAWRDTRQGGYFIKALYEIFSDPKLRHLEIMQLLTRVNNKVAYDFKYEQPNVEYRQCSSVVSMLTKDLYL